MNSLIKLFTVGAVLSLAACSGQSLIDPNLDVNPNLETGRLEVMAVHGNAEGNAILPNASGEKEFDTDLGYHVRLSEAAINWRSLKLISSGQDAECVGGNDRTISLDHAENILGEDLVASLLSDSEVPLAAYCEYEISIAGTPAAIKFHEGEDHGGNSEPGMEHSFHLSGLWEKDAASGSFHIETAEPVVIQGHFHADEDGEIIAHPLHFHEGETEKAITFGNHYDEFLDGIDFAADDEATQTAKVAENIAAGLHQDGLAH